MKITFRRTCLDAKLDILLTICFPVIFIKNSNLTAFNIRQECIAKLRVYLREYRCFDNGPNSVETTHFIRPY